MKIFKYILDGIVKIVSGLLMCLVTGIVLLILHELIIRNFFDRSFKAMTELAGFMFLWMAFLGIIVLYEREALIGLTFFSDRVSSSLKTVFWYVYKLVTLVLGITMVIAFENLYPYISTDYFSSMPTLAKTWEYLPVAIAGGYLAVKSVYDLLEKITGYRK